MTTVSGWKDRIAEGDLATMRSSFGAWRGKVGAEKLIREIYEARARIGA